MHHPLAPDDVFATHVELIESVLAASCRVHRLPADHADEFRSWARLRLLDHDQAILRKFAGRSSFRTYLVTVVERLYLDWRNHEWGKWRPTSEARRLGEAAVELERLVLRDRYRYEDAVRTLVARGIAASSDACDRIWVRLPRHPRRQRVAEEALAPIPAPGAGDPIEHEQRAAAARRMVTALEGALAALPQQDQMILRLRYWSGLKVARIAALLGEDQKALYRRFERLWAGLRAQLEARGITGAALDEGLGTWDPGEGEEADGES